MKSEIEKAKWNIVIAIFVLISGTVVLVLVGTRTWVSQPIARLREGIKQMGQGNLDTRIDFKGHDEPSELAHSFN